MPLLHYEEHCTTIVGFTISDYLKKTQRTWRCWILYPLTTSAPRVRFVSGVFTLSTDASLPEWTPLPQKWYRLRPGWHCCRKQIWEQPPGHQGRSLRWSKPRCRHRSPPSPSCFDNSAALKRIVREKRINMVFDISVALRCPKLNILGPCLSKGWDIILWLITHRRIFVW